MELKEYDKVTLKDGRVGYIVMAHVPNSVFEVDFSDSITDDSCPTEAVSIDDIESVG